MTKSRFQSVSSSSSEEQEEQPLRGRADDRFNRVLRSRVHSLPIAADEEEEQQQQPRDQEEDNEIEGRTNGGVETNTHSSTNLCGVEDDEAYMH